MSEKESPSGGDGVLTGEESTGPLAEFRCLPSMVMVLSLSAVLGDYCGQHH